jgi:pimeloyl-ACP methyl ester carboxylesterase
VSIHRLAVGNDSVRYAFVEPKVASASDSLMMPLLVFVHGAPGGLSDYSSYLVDTTINNKYRMISVDRLGYGRSDYGHPQPSIQGQAEAINQIIARYRSVTSNVVIVGHSYGGPISAYASITSEDIDALVMLAPVNDPASERIFWFSKLLDWKPIYALMPGFIKVATSEKMNHPLELEQMKSKWSQVDIPTYHLHSPIDWIAPGKENMAFSHEHIDSSILKVYDRGDKDHFIPFNDFKFVSDLFLQLDFNESIDTD